MGSNRILSDQQIDEMCALRERGWSAERISQHFAATGTKVSPGSIHWQCLQHGADVPKRFRKASHAPHRAYQRNGHPVRPYTAEDDAKLLELEAQGLGMAAIGRAIGRKPNSVRGRLLTIARQQARAEDR